MNVVVFSGGTATNSLTPCFNKICLKGSDSDRELNEGTDSNSEQYGNLTYVLPISDNGGSTSEILRVFGGPALGDIRSRIVRLINDEDLKYVFSYRLSKDEQKAKKEWNSIVEGEHDLWSSISPVLKELVRSFLISIHTEILKRARSSSNSFNFSKASIGNLFLLAARTFIGGSLDSSIELMMRIGYCNTHLNVIPCINTIHTYHISALLDDGQIIIGQSQISHPSKTPKTLLTPQASLYMSNPKSNHLVKSDSSSTTTYTSANEENTQEDYGNPLYILPELRNSQLHFDKSQEDDKLDAKISKIFYINPYGEEVRPVGNERVKQKIHDADMVVYSIGSLMTSLMPIIILGNIAETLYQSSSKKIKKVLLINNKYDRETYGLSGYEYIKFIVDSMKEAVMYQNSRKSEQLDLSILSENKSWKCFITDIVYLSEGDIKINPLEFKDHEIKFHEIQSDILDNDSLANILLRVNADR
ncbi:hypothetical protein TPHA_0O01250 [Tetrapisispora phaffii CBS 4417]|uniref:Uncharacterized protein n=1 Tax=Tetrapisispora phaffii (strain ATCC 24235 / CBS 4417 / NBRC 1672 / NRRL Y-8282 / UCD 70-5) TaxID=1071381 RepID=G8C1R6_TETPH|nr:hypothetical protein TPHA_0O01250 [Tetrapisispora phaffii CBS 4417]CCE66094.1 hypothetical protein TPHA_0O01250 [Tetrapisispora phaffii CBS 4417]